MDSGFVIYVKQHNILKEEKLFNSGRQETKSLHFHHSLTELNVCKESELKGRKNMPIKIEKAQLMKKSSLTSGLKFRAVYETMGIVVRQQRRLPESLIIPKHYA